MGMDMKKKNSYCIIAKPFGNSLPGCAAASRSQKASARCDDFATVLPGHLPAAADAKDPTVMVQNINTSVCHFEVAAAHLQCAAMNARDHARARHRDTHRHRRRQRLRNTPGPFCFAELVHMQVAQQALQHLEHHHARAGRDGARVQRLVGREHGAAVTMHRAARAERHLRACFSEFPDAPRLSSSMHGATARPAARAHTPTRAESARSHAARVAHCASGAPSMS